MLGEPVEQTGIARHHMNRHDCEIVLARQADGGNLPRPLGQPALVPVGDAARGEQDDRPAVREGPAGSELRGRCNFCFSAQLF